MSPQPTAVERAGYQLRRDLEAVLGREVVYDEYLALKAACDRYARAVVRSVYAMASALAGGVGDET